MPLTSSDSESEGVLRISSPAQSFSSQGSSVAPSQHDTDVLRALQTLTERVEEVAKAVLEVRSSTDRRCRQPVVVPRECRVSKRRH